MSISLFANNLTSKALDLGEQLLQRINDFIPGRRNRDFQTHRDQIKEDFTSGSLYREDEELPPEGGCAQGTNKFMMETFVGRQGMHGNCHD